MDYVSNGYGLFMRLTGKVEVPEEHRVPSPLYIVQDKLHMQ
jgi:hypothetical protein